MRRTLLIAALLLALPWLAATQGQAQTAPAAPGRNPISAEELELQSALRGGVVDGRVSIPNPQAAVLIQPEGRDWRAFHNVTLAWVGGIAVLGMLGVLVLYHLVHGTTRIAGGRSGSTILRFPTIERANHWMVATSFVVLALSGLNLTFGRHVLLPLLGPEAFAALSQWGKYAHNFLAFPFTLGIVVMLLLWVKDNLPTWVDWEWLKAGGGLFGGAHPPAERFNAGQKLMFWITVLGGGVVAATGFLLLFPFAATDIAGMQLSHMLHSILAVLMIAVILGHIYIGTLGVEGAWDAMSTGEVDVNWALQHHRLWAEAQLARERAEAAAAPGAVHAGAAD
ncbi:formate dehydrogenase subunit gamma [Caldovatus aquaticus]|uniref:Formate dehydrogenase subunit gamma n=1 Tax=Caldovatus aquaticus TaxID=2865671 RepID=A0ABS7F683_9PROT|nr:formate dehydrogenase subunit gamma [Caldovatus aquaticus]MBW8271127.1 formate dehydrogenase subunit gamma [Caldovatus aquaticus]